jgi:hypothetical protein
MGEFQIRHPQEKPTLTHHSLQKKNFNSKEWLFNFEYTK